MYRMSRLLALSFVCALALLVAPQQIFAVADDNYVWTNHAEGILGSSIVGLQVNPDAPDTVYATTRSSGIYKTTNGGTSWTAANTGLPDNKSATWGHLYGDLLEMDPNNPDVLYTSMGGKIYKTTDGAANWTLSNTGIENCAPNYQIAGVIVDPNDSTHLYAGHVASGCSGGIFESNDSGANWTRIDADGVGNDVWMLALNPADVSKMYSATQYISFSYSHDGGLNWTNNRPTGASTVGQYVGVHPATTSRVFYGDYTGLYVSEDHGVNMTKNEDVSGSVYDIAFFPGDTDIAYLASTDGVFKTTDAGLNWTAVGSHGSLTIRTIEVHPTDPDIVYVGSYALGMYKSTNGGVTLTAINSGIPTTLTVFALEPDPTDFSTMYLSAGGLGFFKTTDTARSWTALAGASELATTRDIAIAPTNPDVMYGGVTEIYRSLDAGETWEEVFASSTLTHTFLSFAIDPEDANHVFAHDGGSSKILYETVDGGETWVANENYAGTGLVYDIVFDPTDSNIVYIGSYDYVWKSEDGGATWAEKTTGLEGYNTWIDTLAIDPSATTTLYIGTRNQNVLKSTDAGETWTNTAYTRPHASDNGVYRVIVDSSGNVYAMSLYGWRVSTNGGTSWTTLPFIEGDTIFPRESGHIDPDNEDRFVATSISRGAYIYENTIPLFDESEVSVSDVNGGDMEVGDTLTFSMTITNSGIGDGTGVTFSLPVDEDLFSYVDGSSIVNSASVDDFVSGGFATLDVGDLGDDESVEVSFSVVPLVAFNETLTLTIESDEDIEGTDANTVSLTVVAVEEEEEEEEESSGGGGSSSGRSGGGGGGGSSDDDEDDEIHQLMETLIELLKTYLELLLKLRTA